MKVIGVDHRFLQQLNEFTLKTRITDHAVMTVDQDMRTAVGVMTTDRIRLTVDTAVQGVDRALITADQTRLDAHGVVAPEVEELIVVEEAACPRGIMPQVDREQTHRHGIAADVAFTDMIILMIVRPSTGTVELVVKKDISNVFAVTRRELRPIGTDGPHVLLQ